MKYKNAGDELVGRTLTGILPTSCDFGISPVYFDSQDENKQQIEEVTGLVFPIPHTKFISLSQILLATLIYHLIYIIEIALHHCTLQTSIYFSFIDKYPNRMNFLKTNLPWENDADIPV